MKRIVQELPPKKQAEIDALAKEAETALKKIDQGKRELNRLAKMIKDALPKNLIDAMRNEANEYTESIEWEQKYERLWYREDSWEFVSYVLDRLSDGEAEWEEDYASDAAAEVVS